MSLSTLGALKCENCKFEAPEGSRFCPECGSEFAHSVIEKTDPRADTFVSAARQFAIGTSENVGSLGKAALKNEHVQKVAAGAALGAVVGAALPILTLGAGAIAGAALVAYKRITK